MQHESAEAQPWRTGPIGRMQTEITHSVRQLRKRMQYVDEALRQSYIILKHNDRLPTFHTTLPQQVMAGPATHFARAKWPPLAGEPLSLIHTREERVRRVEDALHATRAAVEEGIVPGGGTALLYATKALDGLKGANDDQTRGIDIVRKAIIAPVRQIAENAGHDGAVISGNLLREDDETQGFNAATDTYENLVAAGVIDPTKVVRVALQDAASVAGLLITTEAAITDAPEDKPAAGGGMPDMGGMGGMGGMGF